MEKFKSDFHMLWEKIRNNERFTLARYADGEVMLMKGLEIGKNTQAGLVDKWTAPGRKTKLGEILLTTLNHEEPDYYYAISAPTDSVDDYNYLIERIPKNNVNIVSVNIWINANYTDMLKNLSSLDRPVNLICNYKAKPDNFPFKVSTITPLNNDCVNFFEDGGDAFIEYILDRYKDRSDELFFISCGPVSEVIIDRLYRFNNSNSYIDVGSSIDEYVHGYKTRPYMHDSSPYSKTISRF